MPYWTDDELAIISEANADADWSDDEGAPEPPRAFSLGVVPGWVVIAQHDEIVAWPLGDVDRRMVRRWVSGLWRFLVTARERDQPLRFALGRLPDFEVIYLYNPADEHYGYALNVTDPNLSEWGYAPIGRERECA